MIPCHKCKYRNNNSFCCDRGYNVEYNILVQQEQCPCYEKEETKMKLSNLIAKAKAIVGVDPAKEGTGKTVFFEREVIVLKENKGNALIKCWNCGKETWVKKGSPCHMSGLCYICKESGI